MRSKSKPDRRLPFTIVVIVVLLYGLFMLITENRRKYSDALSVAATAIERNNQIIRNELATNDAATRQVIATGLPMTLTSVVLATPSATS